MAERRVTNHAVQRFIERVDPGASRWAAARRIADMATRGRVRPTPRAWTNARPRPGVVFIYSADEPGACLVATRDAILSVLSRDLCRAGRALAAAA